MDRLTIADTSAWIEFLRQSGSRTNLAMRELLHQPEVLAVTDPVLMEVLAGARTSAERERLRRLLGRCVFLAANGPLDYETAADIHRVCRRRGETVRGLLDCLIAAVAIRAGATVLHADSDFDAIARHTPLGIA